MSRRATTAAARRRLRYGDVFTVFYSSILASAAVVDSQRKDARSKEWNKVIEEAKEQLRNTEIDQTRRLQALSIATSSTSPTAPQKLGNQSGELTQAPPRAQEPKTQSSQSPNELPASLADPIAQDDVSGPFTGVKRMKGKPKPPEQLLRFINPYHQPRPSPQPRHIWERATRDFESPEDMPGSLAPHVVPDPINESFIGESIITMTKGSPSERAWRKPFSYRRFPPSQKKIKTLEISVAKMIFHLLLESAECPTNGVMPLDSSEHLLREQSTRDREQIKQMILEMDDRLNRVKRTDADCLSLHFIESPLYPRYVEDGLSENYASLSLNAKIETIITSNHEGTPDINSMITKICYALMLSNVPPDVHTYNLLMESLCDFDQTELAAIVLGSMLESNIRPNEVTATLTLRYYNCVNDCGGFLNYIKLMGGHGNGLAKERNLDPREIDETQHVVGLVYKKRYQKSMDPTTSGKILPTKGETAIIKKIHPNHDALQELVLGSLKFLGVESAMKQLSAMPENGWETDAKTLSDILEHCSIREDWSHGEQVWRSMELQHCNSTRSDYFWMLRLCLSHQREPEFKKILQLGVDRGDFDSTMLKMPLTTKPRDLKYFMEGNLDERVVYTSSRVTIVGRTLSIITSNNHALAKSIHEVQVSRLMEGIRRKVEKLASDNDNLTQEICQYERRLFIPLIQQKLAAITIVNETLKKAIHDIRSSWLLAKAQQRLEQLTSTNRTLREAILEIEVTRSLAKIQKRLDHLISTNSILEKAIREIEASRWPTIRLIRKTQVAAIPNPKRYNHRHIPIDFNFPKDSDSPQQNPNPNPNPAPLKIKLVLSLKPTFGDVRKGYPTEHSEHPEPNPSATSLSQMVRKVVGEPNATPSLIRYPIVEKPFRYKAA